MRRVAKHVHRKLTPQEQSRVVAARAEAQQDQDAILQKAKRYKQEADAERATLQEALQVLKAERIQQGLSLADIQQRTGIDPPNLSRLENEADVNPTITTLTRYAEALGKRLMIVLADRPAKSRRRQG